MKYLLALTLLLLRVKLSPNNFARAQACERIRAQDLGSTEGGLIAESLGVGRITLIQFNIVCEATAGVRDRYAHVSVVARYRRENLVIESQFEFSCGIRNTWEILVGGTSEFTVATPPDASLNTTLRRDCSLCLSPQRTGSGVNNMEHCAECEGCEGLNMCSVLSCCSYFSTSGTCLSNCPSTASIADFICTCPEGFGGEDCTTVLSICDPNPCENGGRCVEGNSGGFMCSCKEGYTGHRCEEGDGVGDGGCPLSTCIIPVAGAGIVILMILCCIAVSIIQKKKQRKRRVSDARRRSTAAKGSRSPSTSGMQSKSRSDGSKMRMNAYGEKSHKGPPKGKQDRSFKMPIRSDSEESKSTFVASGAKAKGIHDRSIKKKESDSEDSKSIDEDSKSVDEDTKATSKSTGSVKYMPKGFKDKDTSPKEEKIGVDLFSNEADNFIKIAMAESLEDAKREDVNYKDANSEDEDHKKEDDER